MRGTDMGFRKISAGGSVTWSYEVGQSVKSQPPNYVLRLYGVSPRRLTSSCYGDSTVSLRMDDGPDLASRCR